MNLAGICRTLVYPWIDRRRRGEDQRGYTICSASLSLSGPARTTMLMGCRDDDELSGRASAHSSILFVLTSPSTGELSNGKRAEHLKNVFLSTLWTGEQSKTEAKTVSDALGGNSASETSQAGSTRSGEVAGSQPPMHMPGLAYLKLQCLCSRLQLGVVKTHSDVNSWPSRSPSSEHPLLSDKYESRLLGQVWVGPTKSVTPSATEHVGSLYPQSTGVHMMSSALAKSTRCLELPFLFCFLLGESHGTTSGCHL